MIESSRNIPVTYTINSTFGDIMASPQAGPLLADIMGTFGQTIGSMASDSESSTALEAITPEMVAAMLKDMPLRAFISMGIGKMSFADLQNILDQINPKES